MRFFFYGTLIAGSGNKAARAAHRLLRPMGPGTARADLWAIPDPAGWYPALLTPGTGSVCGFLYEPGDAFSPADLAALDHWEDCRTDRASSLYRRVELSIARPEGECVTAHTYCFNQPLPRDARPIAGGDFAAWLAAHGFAAYS